jgi:DedD protein
MNMAKTDTPQATETTVAATADDDALRKRLLSRIAVAGVVIVGLLGGLAVYDSLNKPQAPDLPKMAALPSPPVAEAPKPDEKVAEEKTGEEKTADEKSGDTKQAAADVPAEPERTETPLAPPPLDKPLKAPKPITPPATARAAGIKPAEPALAPARPEARHDIARTIPERVTDRPAAPGSERASARPTERPATRPADSAAAVTASSSADRKPVAHAPASRPLTQAAETVKRFLLQVGVFSNHTNAEELAARLQEAGIPAQVESRVQVGPFASRQEVDAARAKLKTLGIDDGMLVRR